MDNELIRHLTFNFLGLQLVLMATVLLMGNYTGYKPSDSGAACRWWTR